MITIPQQSLSKTEETLLTSINSAKRLKTLNMLFIYCDLVETHMYANHELRLLRIVPGYRPIASSTSGIHLRFHLPEYYPLCKSWFDTISIAIANRGTTIKFDENNIHPIFIQLHFKQVQQ